MELDILLSHSFEEIRSSNKIIALLECAKNYLNLPYTNCEREYRKYYERLKIFKNKKMEPTQDFRNNPGNYLDKKYILKSGIRPYINSVHYDNESITDSIAEKYIKKFPAAVNNFLNEKERAVYEAMAGAKSAIGNAEDAVVNEPIEGKISLLIEAGDFKEAIKTVDSLTGEEVKQKAMNGIKAAEVKAKEEKAKAKKAADAKKAEEAKKLAAEKKAKEEKK